MNKFNKTIFDLSIGLFILALLFIFTYNHHLFAGKTAPTKLVDLKKKFAYSMTLEAEFPTVEECQSVDKYWSKNLDPNIKITRPDKNSTTKAIYEGTDEGRKKKIYFFKTLKKCQEDRDTALTASE